MNYHNIATEARRKVLEMIYRASTSHIGSNFSVIDIATVLYEKADLKKDKIIWSAGWKAATAYYFLAQKGIIPKEDLNRYCQPASPYIGLLEPTISGIECAGGSMGYGFPFSVGAALSKKLKKEEGKVYCIMSDGEVAIGTTWEAMLIAAHHRLDNLVVIVDFNKLQAMGRVDEILNIVPLVQKFQAFNWRTKHIDGHHYGQIEHALEDRERPEYDKFPLIIIAETTKGKGVSFMENSNVWHYSRIDDDAYERAKKELE